MTVEEASAAKNADEEKTQKTEEAILAEKEKSATNKAKKEVICKAEAEILADKEEATREAEEENNSADEEGGRKSSDLDQDNKADQTETEVTQTTAKDECRQPTKSEPIGTSDKLSKESESPLEEDSTNPDGKYYSLDELKKPIEGVEWSKREHFLSDKDFVSYFQLANN